MLVLKFGGSSVASREAMRHVAEIVAKIAEPCVVVVSAMGDTTDDLLEMVAQAEAGDGRAVERMLLSLREAHLAAALGTDAAAVVEPLLGELSRVLDGVRLLREQTPRSRALVSSVGERLSAPILAAHLRACGRPARAADAREFVATQEGRFEEAPVDLPRTRVLTRERLAPQIDQDTVAVVTGFIGATAGGITTTLGRGGSDYTAALLGSILAAREIWIYTDVDGILTADPRLVREARTLPRVSYREAAEMSYFGAKVLHPKTIRPAVDARIPIRIKNTFNPDGEGTQIAEDAPVLPQGVKTVSTVDRLAMVNIEGRGMAGVPGVARRVFEATERARVNVVMISQASSEQTITLVVADADGERLSRALAEVFALELSAQLIDRIVVRSGVTVLSIVGQGMAGTPGVSGKLFGALGAVRVNVLAIAQGSSELSISVAIAEEETVRAVRAVHSAFGLTRVVNVVVLGCGRVGRTFVGQLGQNRAELQVKLGLELRLVGVCSSSRWLFDVTGLDPETAPAELPTRGTPRPDDGAFVEALKQGRFTDLVLVDTTAADTHEVLEQALNAGIHVVLANKRPLSASMAQFNGLMRAARRTGARLGYETTFGAGLPVLHTLQELRDTGDQFREVNGCLSGTLGFLASELEKGTALGAAVAEAARRGLTEPDPREDLSGRDVARKALIIARSLGLALEPDAVELAPLLNGLEHGLEQAIASHGAALHARVERAKQLNKVLRYVATITPERVVVGLTEVDRDGPLGVLRGQDNMMVYRTARYDEFPLVIRGPGAGADVTAAGVLGDVLKAARGG